MRQREFAVYIMASFSGTLYVGVTSDLRQRVLQHKKRVFRGFTSEYNVTRLVYFERHPDAFSAIQREKQLKGWRRSKKLQLVNARNPEWEDLAADWLPTPSHGQWGPPANA